MDITFTNFDLPLTRSKRNQLIDTIDIFHEQDCKLIDKNSLNVEPFIELRPKFILNNNNNVIEREPIKDKISYI